MFRITDVVKHLLIINVLFFLITHLLTTDILAMISGGLFNKEMLPLYYFESNKFLPIQIVTHFFMHGGFAHIFFNMFALVMFGSALETAWGPRRFLFFYLYCALGAALLHTGYNYIDFSNMQSAIDAFAADPSWSKFHHFYKDYVPLDKLNYEYRDEVQRVKDALDDGNMLVKD
ncbi:MAG: rhomboid family intramembrane serine protease, partial [Bacteroidota bacterium]